MSLVVAIRNKYPQRDEIVEVFADTQGTVPGGLKTQGNNKLWQSSGVIIGIVGNPILMNILKATQIEDPEALIKKKGLDRWVFEKLIPQLKETSHTCGLKVPDKIEARMLICYKNDICIMQGDFTISILPKEQKFVAIGSGDHFAIGVLSAAFDDLLKPKISYKTEVLMRMLFTLASKNLEGISAEFTTADTSG